MNIRRKIYLSFAILIVMTLIAKITGLFRLESMSIPGIGMVSLVLSAGMMMLTIRGYQWARKILIILLAISASMFLLSIFIATKDLWASLVLLLFFLCHAYVAMLLRNPDAKRFVDQQRHRYEQNR
ncbi:MAG: hypothetical protein WBA74_15335 [Cyclobacteriaceae bacterium]